MKKDLFKKITAGLAVTASLGMVGCFEDNVKSYEFKNYDNTYTTEETFSVHGIILKLELESGKLKDVNVTPDMIKEMPDMTTVGEKNIVVVYQGKEYSFTITVTAPEVIPEIASVTPTGYKYNYEYGETFTVANTKLIVVKSDNTSQTIDVTIDMIKTLPNMNIAGSKVVTVMYEGGEYSYNILVAGQGSVSIEDIEYILNQENYEVNDTLDLTGTQIIISYSDGSSEIIDVTNEMIVTAPDMSVAGNNKSVIVEYEGNQYTFIINVLLSEEAQMIAKLQEFYQKYLESQETSNVKMSVSGNLNAQMLNNSANETLDNTSINIAKSELTDDLAKDVYNTLVDAVLKTNLDGVKIEDIINVEDLKTKIDFGKLLNFALNNIKTINYWDHLFQYAFPGEDEVYIEQFAKFVYRDMLSNYDNYTDVTKYNKVYSFAEKYFTKLKSFDISDISDLETFARDFRNLANECAYNTDIRDWYVEHLDLLLSDKTENYLGGIAEIWLDFCCVVDGEGQRLNSVYAIAKQVDIKEGIVNTLNRLEKCLVDQTLTKEDLEYLKQETDKVRIAIDEINNNGWKLLYFEYGDVGFIYDIISPANIIFTEIYNIVDKGIIGYVEYRNLVQQLLVAVAPGMPQSTAELFESYIIRIMQDYASVDYKVMIVDICREVGLDANQTQEYIDKWELEGYCTLLEDLATQYIPDPDALEGREYYEAQKQYIVDIAKYLDRVSVDGFDYQEFIQMFNTKIGALNDLRDDYNIELPSEAVIIFELLETLSNMEDDDTYTINTAIANATIIVNQLIDNMMSESDATMVKDYIANLLEDYNSINYGKMLADAFELFVNYSGGVVGQDDLIVIQSLIENIINNFATMSDDQKAETIGDFATLLRMELGAEYYINQYTNQGYTTLLSDFINTIPMNDRMIEVRELIDEEPHMIVHYITSHQDVILKNMMLDLARYIEQTEVTNTFTINDILDIVHNRVNELLDDAERVNQEYKVYEPYRDFGIGLINFLKFASDMTDSQDSFNQNLIDYAERYKNDIIEALVDEIQNKLQIIDDKKDELYVLVRDMVGSLFDNTFDVEDFGQDLSQFVNEACTEQQKTIYNSLMAYYIIQNSDENTDFNEIFSFIELPDGVEEVDYNQLVAELKNSGTYINALKVDQVDTQHIVGDNGLIKEVITFAVSFDFDLTVIKLNADFNVVVELYL